MFSISSKHNGGNKIQYITKGSEKYGKRDMIVGWMDGWWWGMGEGGVERGTQRDIYIIWPNDTIWWMVGTSRSHSHKEGSG